MTPAIRAPRRDGHWPTLLACFLHFDLSFMLWVLIGALGVFAAEEARLGPAQKGLIVAVPVLAGAVLRIPLGMLADRLGGKRVGLAMLLCLFAPLSTGWLLPATVPSLLLTGTLLGVAGASFAVALPLASRCYPPERQGLAMGIAAAGNSGTVIANLLAPKLAMTFGWHAVFALAMLPLGAVSIAFVALARDDAPRPRERQGTRAPWGGDLAWLCFFYAITFGGYVGLGSYLPILFRDAYALSPIDAGKATALVAFLGSASRPVGGYLADRFGGTRMLSVLLVAIASAYAAMSRMPEAATAIALLSGTMLLLGLGNGAVFQIVPSRFGDRVGAATGIVGAAGGLGGFLLPSMIGGVRAWTTSFGVGFFVLACVAAGGAVALFTLVTRRASWREGEDATT